MSYNIDENNIPYVNLTVNVASNMKNIYDVVIDPGHGGDDTGASANGYYESEITLEYALKLKKKLEEIGLKVLLTRENNKERVDAYGENGRAVIPNKVSAKYSISLHLNSNESNMLKGGVEVYAPSNADLTFAKLIADNIVSYANTTYSSQISYKEENGVYVRTFSQSDIKEASVYAKENNYESYNITTKTPYLYMIREVGGIATNAYIDGRNSIYGVNEYYNSNKTAEGYLIELGYMNVSSDLDNLLNNMDSYVKAISDSFKQYCKLRWRIK